MTGFLIYALTAAVVLFEYELVHFAQIPEAGFDSEIVSAAPGSALLLLAAVVSLKKPRIAGFVALLGGLLIWYALLSRAVMAYIALYLSYVAIPYVMPVLITAFLAALSTVYGGLAASGVNRLTSLSTWLFPMAAPIEEKRTERDTPPAVRWGGLMLYIWLAVNAAIPIYRGLLPRNGQIRSYSGWVFLFTFSIAILLVIKRAIGGKNWARISLLVLFCWNALNLIISLLSLRSGRTELAVECVALTSCAAGLILLFASASSRRHEVHHGRAL
jgi:hypothetical protein